MRERREERALWRVQLPAAWLVLFELYCQNQEKKKIKIKLFLTPVISSICGWGTLYPSRPVFTSHYIDTLYLPRPGHFKLGFDQYHWPKYNWTTCCDMSLLLYKNEAMLSNMVRN